MAFPGAFYKRTGYTDGLEFQEALSPAINFALARAPEASDRSEGRRRTGLVGGFWNSFNGDVYSVQLVALRAPSFVPGSTLITEDLGG